MPVFSLHWGAGLLLGSLLALTSCTDQEQPQQSTTAVPATTTPVTSRPDTAEFLDWQAARINGRLPLQSTPRAVWRELGQPDSLVAPDLAQECVSFFSRAFRRGYARGTTVEVYGDTAVVTSLDLQRQPALALYAGPLRLSYHTSLRELAQTFPQAVRQQSPLNDSELGQVTEVTLATGRAPSDDHWMLLFKNGKLVRIDYWMPC